LLEDAPDYVLILPWNIADEVISEHSSVLARGSWFVAAVPELHFIEPVR
jgi:hypothetical protein